MPRVVNLLLYEWRFKKRRRRETICTVDYQHLLCSDKVIPSGYFPSLLRLKTLIPLWLLQISITLGFYTIHTKLLILSSSLSSSSTTTPSSPPPSSFSPLNLLHLERERERERECKVYEPWNVSVVRRQLLGVGSYKINFYLPDVIIISEAYC